MINIDIMRLDKSSNRGKVDTAHTRNHRNYGKKLPYQKQPATNENRKI